MRIVYKMSYVTRERRREYYLQQLNKEPVDVSGGKEYNIKKETKENLDFSVVARARAATIRKQTQDG